MRKLEQSVFPRWQELRDKLGFDGAFTEFAPYIGANVTIRTIDQYTVESSMSLVETNTNYVGTHFGGSLYSMCDPFFMFLLMQNLGEGYMVWDKAASIDFVKPGLGTVKARFHIPEVDLEAIRAELTRVKKLDRVYECEVKDEQGDVVARMRKTLYIRKLNRTRETASC
jgi:acyl-coenzyme A thioesterase PaaI-like protein